MTKPNNKPNDEPIDLSEHIALIPILRLKLKNKAIDILINSLNEDDSEQKNLKAMLSEFHRLSKKSKGSDYVITVCGHRVTPKKPKRGKCGRSKL